MSYYKWQPLSFKKIPFIYRQEVNHYFYITIDKIEFCNDNLVILANIEISTSSLPWLVLLRLPYLDTDC